MDPFGKVDGCRGRSSIRIARTRIARFFAEEAVFASERSPSKRSDRGDCLPNTKYQSATGESSARKILGNYDKLPLASADPDYFSNAEISLKVSAHWVRERFYVSRVSFRSSGKFYSRSANAWLRNDPHRDSRWNDSRRGNCRNGVARFDDNNEFTSGGVRIAKDETHFHGIVVHCGKHTIFRS